MCFPYIFINLGPPLGEPEFSIRAVAPTTKPLLSRYLLPSLHELLAPLWIGHVSLMHQLQKCVIECVRLMNQLQNAVPCADLGERSVLPVPGKKNIGLFSDNGTTNTAQHMHTHKVTTEHTHTGYTPNMLTGSFSHKHEYVLVLLTLFIHPFSHTECLHRHTIYTLDFICTQMTRFLDLV
jgi:hypothetical protein